MSPRRVLVNFAHPVLERSRVNRRLLEAIRDLEGVTVHDLYEAYPTLHVDVAREQELLLSHDVIVFQHPFYWYSTPALLKQWQDHVLEHGWAYGAGGTHLRGKLTFNALSTGGPGVAYSHDGYNRFTIRELLAPWDQTAYLCGMRFLAPFVVHAALRVRGDEDVATARGAYRRLIEAVRDDRLDLERAAAAATLNELDTTTPEAAR
ncbi:MAG TPA: NAD(P)H-dependent oxidoreductase [Kofleriaceae bacterium]|nr:NAD(P)H-dependent oxidoreductase [Kofleriaceae bacterium]